jgi:lipopolysaccharide biosynthesis protein
VRNAHADLASAYGIEGFCYWHYWFAGKRLLELPFDEVLKSGQPTLPFCLGWANESWTGVWHGAPNRILMEQTYPGEEDDRHHFDYLVKAFHDPRYIRVNNKPLLVIYKPLKMPRPAERFELWRKLAEQSGLPGLHIIGVNMDDFDDAGALGLDGAILYRLGQTRKSAVGRKLERIYWGLRRRLPFASLRKLDYARAVKHHIPDKPSAIHPTYPCVIPNWDNTPRTGRRGMVLTNANPENFRTHLRAAIDSVQENPPEERLIFLKAWNEWAEGNYVEPDTTFGHAYLEAIRAENVIDPATNN